jgi:pimeloyl-ACP methyl ester carboxylesterase
MVEPAILVGASSGGLIVRAFASEHTDRVAGLVLVDASHEDQNEEVPSLAPFVPVLSTLGVLRWMGVSFGLNPDSLAPAVQPYARATAFRAAGHRAAVDELMHMRESGEEVRAMRRKLTVPVVVVTGGRGANAGWLELQRDQTTLSENGCQIIAERSGHVVPIDQPEILVNTIAKTVEAARGRKDGPLCGPSVP